MSFRAAGNHWRTARPADRRRSFIKGLTSGAVDVVGQAADGRRFAESGFAGYLLKPVRQREAPSRVMATAQLRN
jgi:hypothetical protein